VLDRTAEFCAGKVKGSKKRGRVITVFSSKGGAGASLIAVNLASALKAPAVLVDLNLQAGNLDLFLGVEPKFSIVDLVENRSRLDDQLISSYITPHSSQLSLLAAPRETDSGDAVKAEDVIETIQILRERFDYVVIDPQHTFDENTLAALDQADDILLPLTLDIPSIRNAQRSLAIFNRLDYPRNKVRVVVNRWKKQEEMDLKQVERVLGERIVGFIPNDYRATIKSINVGQPLIDSDPSSSLVTEIKRIAAEVYGASVGDGSTVARKGILKSMFRRQQHQSGGLDLSATLDKA